MIRLFLGLILVLLSPRPARAIDWRWSYRRMRSPHFDLIYEVRQKALARHFLVAAERAHELLRPIFKEGPSRTLIVLRDDTDESNGAAEFLPYPHITVFPVLPTTNSGLGEYGDWALELMVHEYAHILNMHPAHGFYAPFTYLFGTVVRPNAVLPTWYLEGLAVDLESALTDHGRLRAVETRATARALTLGHAFDRETIATINEQNMWSWPYGNRPYLFGGWWWETVLQKNGGLGPIAALNADFARRVPFLLNGPSRQRTGRTPSEWLEETKSRLTTRADAEITTLRRANAPEGRDLEPGHGTQSTFALSPAGTGLAFVNGEPALPGSVLLKTRAGGAQDFSGIQARVLFRTSGTLQIRWLDENRFVYDALDPNALYVTYRDLYTFDVRTGVTRRLTRNARAQEASPSPNGEQVVFVKSGGGHNSIVTLDLKTLATKRWLKGTFEERFASPEYLTPTEIVFTHRDQAGRETLRRLDLSTGRVSPWLDGFTSAGALRHVTGGHLFSDARGGVRNAYFVPTGQGQAEAVTATLTDVGQVDLDPQSQEIVYAELTAAGRRLRALPKAPRQPAALPPEDLGPSPAPPAVHFAVEDHPYGAARYLLPRYWIPMVMQVENGAVFQGVTSNADPLGRHRYDLSGSIDTVTRRPSYGLSYQNASGPTLVTSSYSKAQTFLGASGTLLEAQSAVLRSAQRWPWNSRRAAWSLGGVWLDTSSTLASYRRMGPLVSADYSNLDAPGGAWHGLALSFSHQEYLPQSGYFAYGRTAVHTTNTLRIAQRHRISLQTRGIFSPRLPFNQVIVLGDRTVGGNYLVNLAGSDMMMRGYASANFIGRKIVNANLEYAFPLIPVDYGLGTLPVFWRSLEVALFVDAVAVDGAVYNIPARAFERTTLGRYFAGTGTEIRFNTTMAFKAPLTFTLGAYYGVDRVHGGGLSPFVGIGLGDLDVLKTGTRVVR